MNRIYWVLVAGMTIFTIVNTSRRVSPAREDLSGALVAPHVGKRLSTLVVPSGSVHPIALSDLGDGTCRYIVIYSPTCGASRTRARQWHQEIYRAVGAPFPRDWTVIWASADSARDTTFFPAGFGVLRVYASFGQKIADDAGAHAYPAHIVLDRRGFVTSGGVGAPLPPVSSFLNDCSIRNWSPQTP